MYRLTALEIAQAAAKAIDSKKGSDIQILGIEDLTIIAEYFVIATGSSTTQVRALANEAEDKLKEAGAVLRHREGMDAGGWILLDFGSVIIHVFLPATRDFYSLDRLWEDAKRIEQE